MEISLKKTFEKFFFKTLSNINQNMIQKLCKINYQAQESEILTKNLRETTHWVRFPETIKWLTLCDAPL